MSLLLSPLREVSMDRHNRAVQALRDGTLTVTLTFKTEAEIRAQVKNGVENPYGVILTEHKAFCSCPDSLHRGVVCKHVIAVCVTCLQLLPIGELVPSRAVCCLKIEALENPIHLWWVDGTVVYL